MRKKYKISWILLLVPVLFTACQILPEEEVLPDAPVVRSYEVKEYKQTAVLRGDLIVKTKVNCTYVPAKEEDLSFSLGGLLVEKIYVTEGQQVKKGDLLAELEQENLQEQISSQEYQLKVLMLQMEHLQEQHTLELRKHEIQLADLESRLSLAHEYQKESLETQITKQEQKKAETINTYNKQVQDIEDTIYIETLRLEELRTDLEARRIYAGIDGTITYVQDTKEGDRSVKDERYITVSDMDTTVFTVKGENAQYFTTGDQVTLTCQKKEYEAEVVDGAQLGLQTEDEAVAYLKLTQPDPTLEDGDRGTIELTLDQRLDTLYVSAKAVKTANGESFVYVLDDNGMRTTQTITTGLVVSGNVEILSGLEEGASVIVD